MIILNQALARIDLRDLGATHLLHGRLCKNALALIFTELHEHDEEACELGFSYTGSDSYTSHKIWDETQGL